MLIKELRDEFVHWFTIVIAIIWFFFLMDISHRQALHKQRIAEKMSTAFYAPEGDGFFRAIVRD